MFRWRVERIEVVTRVLDLGSLRNVVAKSNEDVDDLVDRPSQGMDGRRLHLRSRQSHIDAFLLPSLLLLYLFELLAMFVEGLGEGLLNFVGQLPDRFSIVLRELAQACSSPRQGGLASEGPDPRFLERGEVGRFLNARKAFSARRFELSSDLVSHLKLGPADVT